ncbi:hypothetical protein [Caldiplasma sukawensis]
MGRINVSMKNEAIQKLEDFADKKGRPVSSIVMEAVSLYMALDSIGIRSEDIVRIGTLISLLIETGSVPVPSILLDFLVKNSMKYSEKETLKKWYERGQILGNIIKKYAETLEELIDQIQQYKNIMVGNFIDIQKEDHRISVKISGTGYSIESAKATVSGVEGFFSAYGIKKEDALISEGFIWYKGLTNT